MEQENSEASVFASDNGAYNTASMLALRLDTQPILREWELYLKGEELIEVEENGNVYVKSIVRAPPKANRQGIYSIMAMLRSKLNPQIVQGNLEDFESLHDYLKFFRMNVAEYLMINIYKFEIAEFEFEGIVDSIISTLELFLSRLVRNKERDSYTHTMQQIQKSDTVSNMKSRVPFI